MCKAIVTANIHAEESELSTSVRRLTGCRADKGELYCVLHCGDAAIFLTPKDIQSWILALYSLKADVERTLSDEAEDDQ